MIPDISLFSCKGSEPKIIEGFIKSAKVYINLLARKPNILGF